MEGAHPRPRMLPAGESALVVEFGADADPRHHARVLALDAALAANPIEGIRETVPTYRSLMIHFDPRRYVGDDLAAEIMAKLAALEAMAATSSRAPRRWRIPVCYEPPHAEDLAEVAGLVGLAASRVAELHASATYTAVMYGFAPGFLFLAGLPEALAVSRRRTPRPPAPPGALTIANRQALIASIAMPTGWYMLGRTPARTFDVARDPAFPIAVGDRIAFQPIDAAAFDGLASEAERGGTLLVPDP